MNPRTKLWTSAAVIALSANMAQAAITARDVAGSYSLSEYRYVEIKDGPTQIKVEAVQGDRKIEVIYDKESGDILKSETEAAGEYAARTGLEIDSEDEDFLDDDNDNDDNDSVDNDDEDDDDEDDDDENEDDDDDHDGDNDDDHDGDDDDDHGNDGDDHDDDNDDHGGNSGSDGGGNSGSDGGDDD